MGVGKDLREGAEEDADSAAVTLSRMFFYALGLLVVLFIIFKVLGIGCACKTDGTGATPPPVCTNCVASCPNQGSARNQVLCDLSCTVDCVLKDLGEGADWLIHNFWWVFGILAGTGLFVKLAAIRAAKGSDPATLEESKDMAKFKFDSLSDFGVEKIIIDEKTGDITFKFKGEAGTLYPKRMAAAVGPTKKGYKNAIDMFKNAVKTGVQKQKNQGKSYKDIETAFNKGTVKLYGDAAQATQYFNADATLWQRFRDSLANVVNKTRDAVSSAADAARKAFEDDKFDFDVGMYE